MRIKLWLCLLAGAALAPFSYHQDATPFAAWLAPIFLLAWSRQATRARVAWLGVVGAYVLADLIGLRNGYMPLPPAGVVVASLLGGVVHSLPFAFDRWLAGRVGPLTRTLALPVVATALEALVFRFASFGTWGSAAYAHHGELALLQLVSVTGIWGVTFLQFWLAPVVLDVWTDRDHEAVWRRLAVPASLYALVLGLGSLRLATTAFPADTVRVATVVPSVTAYQRAFDGLQAKALAGAAEPVRAAARDALSPVIEELFTATRATAGAGAELVVWPESVPVLAEDEPALIERAVMLARELEIDLVITPWMVRATDRFPYVENLSVLIDAGGVERWRYPKTHPVPGIESGRFAPGPGEVPLVDTRRARLASLICFDADFPWLVRQAGRGGADLLVVPSDDWPAIREVHAAMAIVRAVENGVSLLRPTNNGISIVSDPYGRVVAAQRTDGAGGQGTLLADVPRRGVRTVYARLGDWFAWTNVAVAFLLVGLGRRGTGGHRPSPAG